MGSQAANVVKPARACLKPVASSFLASLTRADRPPSGPELKQGIKFDGYRRAEGRRVSAPLSKSLK